MPSSILLICTANICRSPVAEWLLRDHLDKAGLDDWVVSSAGTWGVAPYRAPRSCIELMAERGLDLSGHRARLLDPAHLQAADLVLCLAPEHVEDIRKNFPQFSARVHLLAQMAGERRGVKDPYGQSLSAYREMLDDVDSLIKRGLERIIGLANLSRSLDEAQAEAPAGCDIP